MLERKVSQSSSPPMAVRSSEIVGIVAIIFGLILHTIGTVVMAIRPSIPLSLLTLPVALTIFCALMYFRPRNDRRISESVERVLWLIPVGVIWAAYVGLFFL